MQFKHIKILILLSYLVLLNNLAIAQNSNNYMRIEKGILILSLDNRLAHSTLDSQLLFCSLGKLKYDSLIKWKHTGIYASEGWKVIVKNKHIIEIQKPIEQKVMNYDWSHGNANFDLNNVNSIPSKAVINDQSITIGFNQFKSRVTVYEDANEFTIFFLPNNLKANSVYLSGSFNNWSTLNTPMIKTDSGWIVKTNLSAGQHLYKFIIDGRWTYDQENKNKIDDTYSNYNSIYYRVNCLFKLQGFQNAKKIILAGSFNNWNEKELQMQKTASGWQLPLYLKNGTYSYKYIVDKEWILDPNSTLDRPDGRGNVNSMMSIGEPFYFELAQFLEAKKVVLTGSFNEWNNEELLMTKTSTGWKLPYVLASGNYEYKFIVDGNWISDPNNPIKAGNASDANSILSIHPNYTFQLKKFPNAKTVSISGSFNNWFDPGYSMKKVNGIWEYPIYLSPGKYYYKFIVDGEWIIDPDNKLFEDNEFHTYNSFIWFE